MADNFTTDPGTGGVTFASDDIATIHYPRTKLVHGIDGANAGDIATTNPLPVQVRSSAGTELGTAGAPLRTDTTGTTTQPVSAASLPLPSGASTLAEQQTQTTALQLLDDTVATTAAAITAKGVAISGTDGTLARVVKTDAAGELQVDVLTMPTVTVTGTVTANAGSGTQAVSAASLPLPTGASTLAEQQTQTTALQLIDDSVATVAAAITTKGVAAVGTDGTNARIVKTDAAGELQVDVLTMPTVNAAQSGTWTVQPGNTANTTPWLASIHDGTTKATVRDLAANDALNVAIVDGSGNQITTFGGGTQYTEDVAAAADPVGTVPILVRQSTPATVTDANLDNIAQRGTNYGAAYVQVVSSTGALIDAFGGSGGTAQADRSPFTDGTTTATPIAGVFNETSTDPTEDQAAAVRLTVKRALHVNLRDAAGAELAVGGGTQYTEDAVATADPVGNALNLVRADTLSTTTVSAEGDNIAARGSSTGAQYVELSSGVTKVGIANGTNAAALRVTVASDSTGVLGATQSGTWSVNAAGPTAADAPLTGNPVTVGARASDATPTAMSADGDVVNLWADRRGALKVSLVDTAGDSVMDGTNNAVNVNVVTGGIVGRAEDSVHTSGHDGLLVLGIRNDSATVLTDTIGDYSGLATDSAGRVGIADLGGSITVDIPNLTATGSLTAAATSITITSAPGVGSAIVQITGTWVATVQFEGSADGANFFALNAQPVVGGAFVTSSTANGQWLVGVAGCAQVRARCSAFTSGTIVITLIASTTSQVTSLGNSLPAGAATIGSVKVTDGTLTASVRDTGASDALNVAIVDGSGNQITTFGGGTQYTEDAVAATDPTGTAPILVCNTTPTSSAVANLDNVAQRGTVYGAAFAQIVTSTGAFVDSFGGSGGAAQADRSSFIDGTGLANPIAGVFNDTPTDPTEDQTGAVRITNKRALHVNLRDSTGNNVATQASASKASGGVSGDNVLATALVGHFDNSATATVTEENFSAVRISANRALLAEGPVGHNVAASGILPVLIGGFSSAAAPADVSSDTQSVRAWHLRNGAYATQLTASGALIPGDATDGLKVNAQLVNRTASGALGAINNAVTINAQGSGSIMWEIDTGTLSGQVTAEGTLDDTNWFSINVIELDGSINSTISAFGRRGHFITGGLSQARIRVSSYTSGTSNARLEASLATNNIVRLGGTLPSGSQVIGKTIARGGAKGATGEMDLTGTSIDADHAALDVFVRGGGTSGTEYTVNAVVPTDPIGATFVMERDNALSELTEVEGDWTNPRSNANGALWTVIDGTVTVNGSAATQPISAASLPLPTGASTLAEQQTQTTALQLIDDAVATTAAAIPAKGIAISGTDGTNARVVKTDAAGELQVDVLTLPALVAGTANIGDVDVLTLPALVAGTANIGDVDVLTVPAPLSTTGGGTEATALRVTVANDSTGVLSVDDNAGSLTVDGTVTANLAPVTTGGLTISRTLSAATTNATSVKASAGQLYGWYISNINAAVRYVKLYNKASAPTVGTDTPVITLAIPGATTGGGTNVDYSHGIAFATGIAFAITTGVADADTGAVAANDLIVNLFYK